MLHDILNMGWPAAAAITAVAVCLTVNWNLRRMAKLDAKEPQMVAFD